MGFEDYLRFVAALALVLALMGLAAFAARRMGFGRLALNSGAKRLVILEIKPLDHRHRLVLAQCDSRQYLLLIGPEGQTVIDADVKPKAAP